MSNWQDVADSLVKRVNDLIDALTGKMNSLHGMFALKENISNKKNHLDSEDGDHYPSIPAVNTGLTQTLNSAKTHTNETAEGLEVLIEGKVDKDGNKVLSDYNFSLELKEKLESLESSKFRGTFPTFADLINEHPEGEGEIWHNNTGGWYADVDKPGEASERYIWDANDLEWVSGGVGGLTPEQVLNLYESNADRNAFTDARKDKLDGVETGAQKNVQSNFDQNDTTKDDYIKNRPTKLSDFENDALSDFPSKDWVKDRYDSDVGKGIEAYNEKHTHSNKDVLDGIDQTKIDDWNDAKNKAHEHRNKSVLDDISSQKVSDWDEAHTKAHEHENKAILDSIDQERMQKWDNSLGDLRVDESLHFENNVLRSNMSTFTETFILNSNQHDVELQHIPTNILAVRLNGVPLDEFLSEYSVNNDKIEVLDPRIPRPKKVSVTYQHIITNY